jgi:hypothetical protein
MYSHYVTLLWAILRVPQHEKQERQNVFSHILDFWKKEALDEQKGWLGNPQSQRNFTLF